MHLIRQVEREREREKEKGQRENKVHCEDDNTNV